MPNIDEAVEQKVLTLTSLIVPLGSTLNSVTITKVGVVERVRLSNQEMANPVVAYQNTVVEI